MMTGTETMNQHTVLATRLGDLIVAYRTVDSPAGPLLLAATDLASRRGAGGSVLSRPPPPSAARSAG